MDSKNSKKMKIRVPISLFDKGEMIRESTGLHRTEALGLFSEGISLPSDILIKRMPRSKSKKVTLIWRKEIIIK